jgi:hypothetical protein
MQYQRLHPVISIVAVAIALLASSVPAQALFGSGKSLPKPEEVKAANDKATLALMIQIGHSPELMNVRYLSYVLGPTENDKTNDMQPLKHYRWYESDKQNLSYELVQNEITPGRIVQSSLVAHMANLKMSLADIESKYGVAGQKFFDQHSAPNIKYSYAPLTTVDFVQPHNAFRVTESVVSYTGPSLPGLTNEELNQAIGTHKARALDHHKNQRWSSAIPTLRERVADNPSDTQARMALAESYKNHSNLNDAIQEYHTVLSQTTDSQTQAQCIKALQDMRVLPPPGGFPQEQTLKLVRNCQGMQTDVAGSNAESAISGGQSIDVSHPRALSAGYDASAGF